MTEFVEKQTKRAKDAAPSESFLVLLIYWGRNKCPLAVHLNDMHMMPEESGLQGLRAH